MREATQEEREGVERYINSIAEDAYDVNIKKDLKGRQKKIEKLMAENYVLARRVEVAEENLQEERAKNVRLYSRYICAIKELAQYKKKEGD